MFLKSLELKGFKSFADRTDLVFEPGVTVIVGPNGSGKSNIVDAVSWVLGTQATKSLRGAKMEDVIFAGTPQRPALGRAQAVLTIDNSGGFLPVDFAEVTLTRTLYRNGESEYAINGAPCRLLDIQELVSDTGVGRQMHTIIGQGQLDTVLSARPEDRRAVIEEAAGILKYRRRKEKALRRLAATEGNLLRLQDLLRELGRQLRPLERQADAARRYDAVAQRLRDIRRYLAGDELRIRRTAHSRVTEALETVRHELGAGTERMEQARTATSELTSELSAAHEGREELRTTELRTEALAVQLEAAAELAAERARAYRERLAAPDVVSFDVLESELGRLRERLAGGQGELATLRDELTTAVGREEGLLARHEELRARAGDFGDDAGRRAAELMGERSALDGAVVRSEAELARLAERRRSNSGRLDRARQERERLATEIERLDSEATPLAAEVDRLRGLRDSLDEQIEHAESERRRLESEAATWDGRLEALRLAAEEELAADGGRNVVQKGGDGITGILGELVVADSGCEGALEAALGDVLQAVIVSRRDAISDAVVALKAEEAGVATFVEVSAEPERTGESVAVPTPGEAAPLIAHVRPARHDPALAALLQRLLARTYLVENWQAGWELLRRYPDVVLVTASGDRLSHRRGFRGGSASSGMVRRRASMSEVAEKARRAEREHAEADRSLQSAKTDRAAVAGELEGLEAALLENDALLTSAAGQLARIGPEIEELAAEEGLLAEAEAELTDRISNDRDRLAEIDRVLAGLEGPDSEALSEAEAVKAELRETEEALREASAARSRIELGVAQKDERESIVVAQIEEIEARLESERVAQPVRQAARSWASEAVGKADAIRDRAREAAAEARRMATALAAECAGRQQGAGSVTDRLAALRAEVATLDAKIAELSARERSLEIEQAEEALRLEQAEDAIRVEFGADPGDAISAVLPEGLAEADAPGEAGALEREIKHMGPVNPLALQEYEELAARRDFVGGQLEDLKASRRELQKVVRAVERKIVEIFEEAFADVTAAFGEIFPMLFPGGAGRVKLAEAENPLESGVEIEARPSGKNVHKLSLLSGGERSLTALAFLFSVFRARPSPFYLLDEVEAALDDLNLHRFLELVAMFKDESQLILVTHQKRTMEVASCLYGVSMQDTGVSKVISHKVAEGAPIA